jgi:hypothetical protein
MEAQRRAINQSSRVRKKLIDPWKQNGRSWFDVCFAAGLDGDARHTLSFDFPRVARLQWIRGDGLPAKGFRHAAGDTWLALSEGKKGGSRDETAVSGPSLAFTRSTRIR